MGSVGVKRNSGEETVDSSTVLGTFLGVEEAKIIGSKQRSDFNEILTDCVLNNIIARTVYVLSFVVFLLSFILHPDAEASFRLIPGKVRVNLAGPLSQRIY